MRWISGQPATLIVIQAMARVQVGSYIEILGLAPCFLH